MRHDSNRMQRAKDMIEEGVYLKLWQERQKRVSSIDDGFGVLDLILNNKCYGVFPAGMSIEERLKEIDNYSQRDAYVAASVIQWLGTKEGLLFIKEAERRIKIEKKAASRKFHQVNNLGITVVEPDKMPLPF